MRSQVSSIFVWTYLYIIVGTSVDRSTENMSISDSTASTISTGGTPETFQENITESLLPSTNIVSSDNLSVQHESTSNRNRKVTAPSFNQPVYLLIYFDWRKLALVITFKPEMKVDLLILKEWCTVKMEIILYNRIIFLIVLRWWR